MKNGKYALLVLAASMMGSPVLAQQTESGEVDQARKEYQSRQEELKLTQKEIDERMREAEQRLAEAAQQIAELSSRQLPRVAEIERRYHFDGRPKLGITIGDGDASGGPAEGVGIVGVSPGGAADEAGLRADDTITAINGESMSADSARAANRKLMDFMSGVKVGDTLKVEYLRKGKSGSVELTPQVKDAHVFAFGGPGFDHSVPAAPMAPGAPHRRIERHVWMAGGSGFGDMELVSLTERLGKYFGTDKGLLVVRAPGNEKFKLEDGDVIQRIDGREPTSVSHAMRILGSYQSGEKFEIEIMRDRKRQKISVDMPDNRQSRMSGFFGPRMAPEPAAVPAAPAPANVPGKPADRT